LSIYACIVHTDSVFVILFIHKNITSDCLLYVN